MRRLFFLLSFIVLFVVLYAPRVSAQPLSIERVQEATREWLIQKLRPIYSLDTIGHLSVLPPLVSPQGGSTDRSVVNTNTPESEIHAAINPTDTNNIVVAAMQYVSSDLGAELRIPIFYTTNFGETWQQSTFSPTNINPLDFILGGGDPVLAFTPDGKVHLTWLLFSFSLPSLESRFTIYHATSNNKGATWVLDEENVDSGVLDIIGSQGRAVDKEWLAVDNTQNSPHYGNLYVAYTELTLGEIAHYRILFKTWNESAGFSTPVVAVDSVDYFISQFAVPTVAPNGDIHLFWLGASYQDYYLGLFHAKSVDGGQSFSGHQLVSYVNVPCFPPMTSTTPCIPGIDADRTFSSNYILAGNTPGREDQLYVTWSANGYQEEETPGFDIYFARSTDAGQTWSSPVLVNQDANPNIHNFMPNINLTPSGTLSVHWYDQREALNGVQTNYRGVQSSDGGVTFSEDYLVSFLPSDFMTIGALNDNFGVGEYNATVSTQHYVMPFWADGRAGGGNLDIYFAKIPVNTSMPTSIRSLDASNLNVVLSPNPAKDQIRITINNDGDIFNGYLAIYTSQGQQVYFQSIQGNGLTTRQLEASLAGLSPGNYFIVFSSGESRVIEHFVKM